jgi:DNA-binding transcriptional LysR family regulator
VEIRQLRYFVAAAEAGNIRKACEKVHISHSALSISLKKLEDDLGVTLLNKGQRGVQLTYAGEKFLKSAHLLLRQIDDLRTLMQDSEDTPTGNVRLGLPFGINNALAAELFKILRDKFPGISLEVEEGNSASLERLFENGVLDVMVSYDAVGKMDQKCESLYVENLYLVGPYDDKLSVDSEVELKNLGDTPIACSPSKSSLWTTLEKCAFDNNVRFNYCSDFQSAHASLKIVEAGLAHTISPWDEIYDYVFQKRMSAQKIINPPMERTVCLVSSLNNVSSFATMAAINVIKEAVERCMALGYLKGEPLLSE